MKKLTTMLLTMTIFMVFSLAACSDNNAPAASDISEQKSSAEDTNSNKDENDSTNTVKILVAYFSATNTTKGVAETIADSLNADLYEITPKDPYTDADLNYHDDKSRSTIEMNDSKARPAITGSVENMAQYDIVFIGYPIWLAYHNLIQCTQG